MMKQILFALCILGLVLTVTGWFFDQASHFPLVLETIAPDATHAVGALDTLSQNDRLKILPKHPGFDVLLKQWPDFPDIESVADIRRSFAYTLFGGGQIENDFDLFAYDVAKNQVGPSWRQSVARGLFQDEIDRKLFRNGSIIFFGGLLIVFISALLSFLEPNRENQSADSKCSK